MIDGGSILMAAIDHVPPFCWGQGEQPTTQCSREVALSVRRETKRSDHPTRREVVALVVYVA